MKSQKLPKPILLVKDQLYKGKGLNVKDMYIQEKAQKTRLALWKRMRLISSISQKV